MGLDPQKIEYIDVIRPIEAIHQFGEIGRNGIISIKLKAGISMKSDTGSQKKKIVFATIENRFTGYDKSLPDSYPDFREQLFWSSEISVENNQKFNIRFKASYLEGDYFLLINGITSDGKPIVDLQKIKISSEN
jgi:hypothetical protein